MNGADDLLGGDQRRVSCLLLTVGLLNQFRPLFDLPTALRARLFDAVFDLRLQPGKRLSFLIGRGMKLACRCLVDGDRRCCDSLLHKADQIIEQRGVRFTLGGSEPQLKFQTGEFGHELHPRRYKSRDQRLEIFERERLSATGDVKTVHRVEQVDHVILSDSLV